MKMSEHDAKSRMQRLFFSNISLLRHDVVKQITESNRNDTVYHVLSTVRPTHTKERLKLDLKLAYSDLKKNFKGFMKHGIKVSEAFEIVEKTQLYCAHSPHFFQAF